MEGHFTPGSLVTCVIYRYINLNNSALNLFFVYVIVHTDEEICEWNLVIALTIEFKFFSQVHKIITFESQQMQITWDSGLHKNLMFE